METTKAASRIGDILAECGMVSQQQIQQALEMQTKLGMRLGEVLVHLGYIDQDRLTWALGIQLDLSYVDLQVDMIDWDLLLSLPIDRLRAVGLLPFSRIDGTTVAVVHDPLLDGLGSTIEQLLPGEEIMIQLSSRSAIESMLEEATHRLALRSAARTMPAQVRLLDQIDAGVILRALAVRTTWDGFRRLFTWTDQGLQCRPISATERDQMITQFEGEFVEELALPGGFCGMRKSQRTENRRAIRAIGLAGADGWLVGFERLPGGWPASGNVPVQLTWSPEPIAAKHALLSTLAEILARPHEPLQETLPVFSLETRLDNLVPGVFQCEISDASARIAAARHLATLAPSAAVVVEVETPDDIRRASSICRAEPAAPFLLLLRPAVDSLDSFPLPANVTGRVITSAPESSAETFLKSLIPTEDV